MNHLLKALALLIVCINAKIYEFKGVNINIDKPSDGTYRFQIKKGRAVQYATDMSLGDKIIVWGSYKKKQWACYQWNGSTKRKPPNWTECWPGHTNTAHKTTVITNVNYLLTDYDYEDLVSGVSLTRDKKELEVPAASKAGVGYIDVMDNDFDAYEEYDNLLGDYEYDVAMEQAREERVLKRLQGERKQVLRAKKKLNKFN